MIASVGNPAISTSSSRIDPVIWQGTLLVTHPSRVDFPAPLDPSNDTIRPRSTDSVTSESAATDPYLADRPTDPYLADRPDISSMLGFVAQIGSDHRRGAPDFGRRSFAYFLPMVEHHHSVAHGHDHTHVVLDQQHGDAVGIAQTANRLGNPTTFFRIHPGRRFVEEQQLRLAGEGSRQLHRLLHSVRQVGYRDISHFTEATGFENAVRLVYGRPAHGAGRPQIQELAPQFGSVAIYQTQRHVFPYARLAKQLQILEGPANSHRGNLMNFAIDEISAVETDSTGP